MRILSLTVKTKGRKLSFISGNRFLVMGRAGMDLYADPPGTRLEDAEKFTSALGGSAANIAVAIARLGGRVSLFSAVSDDAVGRFVMRQLRSYEIDPVHVIAVGGQNRNSLAIVETRSENCQNIIYRNSAADFQLDIAQLERVDWRNYDCLIATGTGLAIEPSRSVTLSALRTAKQAGLTTVLDVDYRPYSWRDNNEAAKICGDAADACDIIVGNDDEFAVLAKGGDGLACAKSHATGSGKLVVYKMGAKGSVTFAANEAIESGIYRTTALKPTGAGDSFMGGFVTGLSAGLTIGESVRRGSACAAMVVGRVGCAPAMPTPHELATFMSNHPGPN
jgi:5-dehydro-2-deoxygluconokinase